MPRKLFIKFIFWSCWIGLISTGIAGLWQYAATAGESANAPRQWPVESKIVRSEQVATLLITLHPHCPCSRATLGELARLMSQAEGLLEVHALFIRPPGVAVDWEKTDLWWNASRIPGVIVTSDEKGKEARYFGAKASGQVILYDKAGRRLFSGVITAWRGHAGDNEGRAAIVALLREGAADKLQTPVYGCSLFAAEDGCTDQPACPTNDSSASPQ